MKNGIVLLAIMGMLLSCNDNRNNFLVSGELSNGAGEMVYLKEMTSMEMIPHDSTRISSSGFFELKGMAPEMKFFAVHTRPESFVYLLAEDGDDITLKGDAMDLPLTYDVEGSEHSARIRNLTREQNRALSGIQTLSTIFNENLRSPDFEEIKASLDSSYENIVNSQREFTFHFIDQNLHSLASLMALYQQIGPRHYLLDAEKDFQYFARVDSSLSILYPESDAVGDLHRQVEELRQKKEFEEMTEARLGTGRLAPEIALPDPDGDTILLSTTRGKIVLLDFWAAWYSPCRLENPNLVKVYKKYRDEGFEIFQVSLDQSRDAWLKGIKDDQLDWIHVSDLQFWNSVVVPVYNIQGIPMNFLLDREGKIIAQNLRGSMLEQKLEEVFNPSN